MFLFTFIFGSIFLLFINPLRNYNRWIININFNTRNILIQKIQFQFWTNQELSENFTTCSFRNVL